MLLMYSLTHRESLHHAGVGDKMQQHVYDYSDNGLLSLRPSNCVEIIHGKALDFEKQKKDVKRSTIAFDG